MMRCLYTISLGFVLGVVLLLQSSLELGICLVFSLFVLSMLVLIGVVLAFVGGISRSRVVVTICVDSWFGILCHLFQLFV